MRSLKALLPALVLFLVSCKPADINPSDQPNLSPLTDSEQSISGSSNDFTFNLLRNVSVPSANTFISPLSVGMALGMVLNGAAGSTKEGILKTIDFTSLQPSDVNQGYHDLSGLLTSMDNKIDLGIANSVWYGQQYQVNSDFAVDIKNFYNGTIQGVNFDDASAAQTINNWVDSKTNHQIQNIIDDTNGDVMVLVNAIYFKGDWTYQFDKTLTKKGNFNSESGIVESVDMMSSNKVNMSTFENSNVLGYDIPYGNGQFTMTIILPVIGNTIEKVMSSISADSLDLWLNHSQEISTGLRIPKFNMKQKTILNDALSNLGMGIAFGVGASFPNLLNSPEQGLEISRVIHEAAIEVDEEGTTAAAATVIEVTLTSTGSPPFVTIDRPFIFLIREKHSGVILFAGQLFHPSAN